MPRIHELSIDQLNLNSTSKTENGSTTAPTDTWQLVALYQILQELRTLNRTLACPNFQDIPRKLDQIVKNTRKRKRKVAKKAAGVPSLRVVR